VDVVSLGEPPDTINFGRSVRKLTAFQTRRVRSNLESMSRSKHTRTTTKTTVEIELQRKESVSDIRCSRCEAKAEIREVSLTPPGCIGSAITSYRIPDGWWVQGNSFFTLKATCPGCFETPFKGVVEVIDDD
jgi:hypothetical protein